MARSTKEIKYKKPDYLEYLKSLTRWLGNKNKRNPEELNNLIKKHKITNSNIFLRICSYSYNRPHIIWYFNKYFNNFFEFNVYDIENLVFSLCHVLDCNKHNNSRSFYYLKSNDLKDFNKQQVKKIIKDYFLIIKRKHINDIELNFFYNLFNKGLIEKDALLDINTLVNGEESKINIQEPTVKVEQEEASQEQIDEYFEYYRTRELPKIISDFSQELKNKKENRSECQKCKLKDSPMVILDTNREDFGEVDFAFFALNPGGQEKVYGKPFVGASGKLQRKMMFHLPKESLWMMTNVILCYTANQKEIGKNDKQIKEVCDNCRELVIQISSKFPAKYYIPVGKPAAQVFGINQSITQVCGEIIDMGGNKVIPLIHPSAVIQYHGKMEEAYNLGWNTIYSIAKELHGGQVNSNILQPKTKSKNETPSPQTKNVNISNLNIPNNKMINNPSQIKEMGLTYFDTFNLGKNLLNIFIDQNGVKFYLIEENETPIYIKNSNWNECDMIISNPDQYCYINGYNRFKLLNSAKDNMETNKKSVLIK